VYGLSLAPRSTVCRLLATCYNRRPVPLAWICHLTNFQPTFDATAIAFQIILIPCQPCTSSFGLPPRRHYHPAIMERGRNPIVFAHRICKSVGTVCFFTNLRRMDTLSRSQERMRKQSFCPMFGPSSLELLALRRKVEGHAGTVSIVSRLRFPSAIDRCHRFPQGISIVHRGRPCGSCLSRNRIEGVESETKSPLPLTAKGQGNSLRHQNV
jgi:hypothetical protein